MYLNMAVCLFFLFLVLLIWMSSFLIKVFKQCVMHNVSSFLCFVYIATDWTICKSVNKLIHLLHVVLTYSYVPSVWPNIHNCTSLLVQRHHTVLGKRHMNHSAIGRVSLARENEAGGNWGQEIHIFHVNV